VRRPGAGNKPIRDTNPTIELDLGRLLEDSTRGDPESPLRWTSKSTAKLAAGLVAFGHHVSEVTVQRVLKSMGFSLQANRKTREGEQHPDRDAQFRYISRTAKAALAAGQPVISVDSKKRELVGNFKAVGREWAPKGEPVEVSTHDFKDKELGHAIPHGIFDPVANEGWVTVGTVPSYCTSSSLCLSFDVGGVRDVVSEFLFDVGSERDGEASGGAAAGL